MTFSETLAVRPLPKNLQKDIEVALGFLRRGGVVAFPTDTLYGMGARALDPRAVERVFLIKARPRTMGLPLLLVEAQDMERMAAEIPDLAWRLAQRFWPGPLTLVLKKAHIIPAVVTGGADTVAVRVPNHPVPRGLAGALGEPITGTSANRSGGGGAVSALEVRRQLGASVDYIVDGGTCPVGRESTVLDLTGEAPRILRQGALSLEAIQAECPMLVETVAS